MDKSNKIENLANKYVERHILVSMSYLLKE